MCRLGFGRFFSDLSNMIGDRAAWAMEVVEAGPEDMSEALVDRKLLRSIVERIRARRAVLVQTAAPSGEVPP